MLAAVRGGADVGPPCDARQVWMAETAKTEQRGGQTQRDGRPTNASPRGETYQRAHGISVSRTRSTRVGQSDTPNQVRERQAESRRFL